MPSFEKRSRYGFEMVDAPAVTFTIAPAASIENLRRIESLDFFTDFPRFSFNADTRGLSRPVIKADDCEINRNEEKVGRGRLDVLPAAHGVLAGAGAGAVAPGEDA
jgi:hypothetical protein